MEISDQRLILTPTELNRQARELLERLSVWVQGEVIEYSRKPGWVYAYFTIKDTAAQIKCVVSPHLLDKLSFTFEDGKEVLLFGKVSLYETRGEYQLKIQEIEEVGAGSLQKQLEELKAKLQKEGLFDTSHKKSLPPFPEKIAVVTSEKAAAWHDVQKVIQQRFPAVELLLADTLVEGKGAPESIIRALKMAQSSDADLIILTRGGGAVESLMAFNDEAVTRAVFTSQLPVICAIGHEKDVSIAELAADVRAATPSNAAELAVRDRRDLLQRLDQVQRRIALVIERFAQLPETLDIVMQRIERRGAQLVVRQEEKLQLITRRLFAAVPRVVQYHEERFQQVVERIQLLSPQSTLERGYSIATTPQGNVVRTAEDVAEGDNLIVKLQKGRVHTHVTKISKQ